MSEEPTKNAILPPQLTAQEFGKPSVRSEGVTEAMRANASQILEPGGSR